MALYPQPNLTGGVDETFVEIASAVPSFVVGILMFVWGVIFISGSATQKRRSGYADLPMWSTMASISTLLISLLFTLKSGIITLEVLGIVVAITIFSAIWLFLSKGRGEV